MMSANPGTRACYCTPRYANSLLYGLPQTTLQRLQRVQNCAARLFRRLARKYTTSRQCYSICTGYRVVCARHIKCFCLLIRWCVTKRRVTSRNYIITASTKSSTEVCDFAAIDTTYIADGYSLWSPFCRSSSRSVAWTAYSVRRARTQPQLIILLKTHLLD